MTSTELGPVSLVELRDRCDELASEVSAFGPRSVPRDLRRRHIVACAHVLFIERGYELASMTDVAAMAGITKPVIYDQFSSKEELFAVCMADSDAELAARIARALEAEPDPGRHLFAGGHAYFEYVQERRAAWTRLLRMGGSPVREWEIRMRERQARGLGSRLVRDYQRAGVKVSPRRAAAAAQMATGAAEALAAWWTTQPDISLLEISEMYATCVGPGIHLLLTQGPQPPAKPVSHSAPTSS